MVSRSSFRWTGSIAMAHVPVSLPIHHAQPRSMQVLFINGQNIYTSFVRNTRNTCGTQCSAQKLTQMFQTFVFYDQNAKYTYNFCFLFSRRGTAEHFYTIPYKEKIFFHYLREFFYYLLYIWYIFVPRVPHLRTITFCTYFCGDYISIHSLCKQFIAILCGTSAEHF